MENRDHIGVDNFRKINWLPTKERFEQCLLVNIYKFFNKMAPDYYDEMYYPAVRGQNTRFSFQKLMLPSRCTEVYGHWTKALERTTFSFEIV